MQFVTHWRNEPLDRSLIAGSPREEQPGDIRRRCWNLPILSPSSTPMRVFVARSRLKRRRGPVAQGTHCHGRHDRCGDRQYLSRATGRSGTNDDYSTKLIDRSTSRSRGVGHDLFRPSGVARTRSARSLTTLLSVYGSMSISSRSAANRSRRAASYAADPVSVSRRECVAHLVTAPMTVPGCR
jgi:hypothetical protein